MTEQLTKGERTILQYLLDHAGLVPARTIAEELGQNEERIVSILNALSERGLVHLATEEIESFSPTEEGLDYAEHDLPEFRLFDAVQELGGEASMNDAIAKAQLTPQTKGIAISWAKKKGLLEIVKAGGPPIFKIKGSRPTRTLRDLLQQLKTTSEVSDDMRDLLKQGIERKLITVSKRKEFSAKILPELTDRIRSLLARETEGVVELTPEMLSLGTWRGKSFKPFNVEIDPAPAYYGKKHPYAEFIDWLKEILVGLGFTEWFGPYVETEFWNNDALFVPQDHPAREVQDQFRVVSPYDHGDIPDEKYYKALKATHENGGTTGSTGWKAPFSREITTRLVLRSHTTPVSVRYLWEHPEPPQKMFIIDRNFRSETLNATHAQEFDQCEGIISDHNLTLRDLMGYIGEICKRVGLKKMKWKPGQFPFTEPSIEGYAKHDVLGWIEVAPGGIFRPEVTYPLGIKNTVLAWGLGAGRMYMASLDIRDIREIFTRDLNWLRQTFFVR